LRKEGGVLQRLRAVRKMHRLRVARLRNDEETWFPEVLGKREAAVLSAQGWSKKPKTSKLDTAFSQQPTTYPSLSYPKIDYVSVFL